MTHVTAETGGSASKAPPSKVVPIRRPSRTEKLLNCCYTCECCDRTLGKQSLTDMPYITLWEGCATAATHVTAVTGG